MSHCLIIKPCAQISIARKPTVLLLSIAPASRSIARKPSATAFHRDSIPICQKWTHTPPSATSPAGLPLDKIKDCMGHPQADVENSVLKNEQKVQVGRGNRGDVTILPTLVINNVQYRGILERSAVLRAICAGFKKSSEPAVCLSPETNECLKENGGCWQDTQSNITACKDTFRGRICECPITNGVQYQGDGYTSCKAVGPARCNANNGGCWVETKNRQTFSACSELELRGCNCPFGFRGDGLKCEDVDECMEQLVCQCDGCTCKNTWGGFDCKCKGDLLYIKGEDVCIVSKLPLYAFPNASKPIKTSSKEDWSSDFFLNTLLLGQWEEQMSRGLFRYDVTACETKVIPGKHGFIAQLNEGRHLKKRPTEFRVDRVLQPFDSSKFNFTKVGQEEVLFRFEAGSGNLSHYYDRAPVNQNEPPSVVAINVSPIEYGHVLLIPRVLECLPQRIDPDSFLLALHMAEEAGSPYFRLGYNSLGAFATINLKLETNVLIKI